VAVSVFRVPPAGGREPFVTGIVNATSLAFDRHGRLHVSSRFDGSVYRIDPQGVAHPVASDLGVTCGLAFAEDGSLFAGDRTGTVFRILPDGRASAFATLPPSVAAFHLALGPDAGLYVTAPTLSSHDPVYRIDPDGRVRIFHSGFGRPQGLAFDAQGRLYVVEALAGSSGLYRLAPGGPPEVVVAGDRLVGVAFGRTALVVTTNETAYRLDLPEAAPLGQ
jgi:sugar lactone lactonase YvrE